MKRFKLVVYCDDDILCRMTKVMADESLINTKYDVVSSYGLCMERCKNLFNYEGYIIGRKLVLFKV